MGIRQHLAKRVLAIIPTLVGLSLFIFLLVRVLPGDPAAVALGEFATREQIEQLRRELWLDRPVHIQYIKFISDLSKLRLGMSTLTWHDVSIDVFRLFPATLELAFFAMLIGIFVGVLIGIISAEKQNKALDYLLRPLAVSGVAFPRYFIAIVMQLVLCYLLRLFPLTGRIDRTIAIPPGVTGFYLIDSLLALRFDAFISCLEHIILPATALAISPIAQLSRLVRTSMLEEKRKDYALTLQANAMPKNVVANKYMLKNAFSVALTTIGQNFGFLLGGSFLVETVFAWPGLGRYGAKAVLASDLNAIVAVALIMGLVYSFINLIVDLLYGYLDPRVAVAYAEQK